MVDFLSLPAEVRLEIYRYLIPHDRFITFRPSHVLRSNGYAVPPAYNAKLDDNPSPMYNMLPVPRKLSVSTNLFLVNRQIFQEASDILYHENTFRFVITHAPARIHGCCLRVEAYEPNLAREFPMLQPSVAGRIRRMDLYVAGDLETRLTNRNLNKWLTKVASNLTEEGNQLEYLKVTLLNSKFDRSAYSGRNSGVQIADADRKNPIRKGQYVLEPLVELRQTKNVVIEGEFLDCFPSKLARVMESRDITLPIVEYEDKIVWKRRHGQKKKSKSTIPGKEWFEPAYDWSAVPEAVEKEGASA
jgi:hypothetical protein